MSVVRPLPARPNLAHERKAAKALLRQLRAGEPEAIARARAQHPDFNPRTPQLADAQLTVAREYGFTSWPRLAQYFEAFRRQMLNLRPPQVHFHSDDVARAVLRGHAHRDPMTGRTFAAYVPRYFALPMDEVFALAPTEDEARLAAARQSGTATWDERARAAEAQKKAEGTPWEETPDRLANRALEAADLVALQRIAVEHPEVLQLPDARTARWHILKGVLWHERKIGRDALRPIVEWLRTQGLDVQDELNRQLCGHIQYTAEDVRWLLDRGANPRWIAPNGYSVLEHALLNFWNGEAVDLIAARVTPPRALWVAAGLGDIEGVARFLDRRGRPTAAARRNRPAIDAMSFFPWPSHPEPQDEEVLMEAFHVAMLNGRVQMLEYLARRGAPINSLVFGAPPVYITVGNDRWVPVFECLVSLGADLDLRSPSHGSSTRQHVEALVAQDPANATYQRLARVSGIDVAATVQARNATPLPEPRLHSSIARVLELAQDDARRAGSAVVAPGHLLFGLLRHEGVVSQLVAQTLGAEARAFRERWAHRLLPAASVAVPQELPLDAETEGVLERARNIVRGKRQSMIGAWHLLEALMEQTENPVDALLAPFGRTCADIRAKLHPVG